jgi:hypothetical protein
MQPLSLFLHNPRQIAVIAASVSALIGLLAYRLLRRELSPEEIETARRSYLTANGHIVDGSLIDATPNLVHPQTLFYSYRVGGVEYECTQDISTLTDRVRLDPSMSELDLPIQVRYNGANPGDSIVVAETWNGLWSLPRTGSQ